MPELLAERDFVAMGKVAALVPGWSDGRIQTMLYLEVEEVLSCDEKEELSGSGVIEAGSLIATLYDIGRYEIDGVELCSQSQLGLRLPNPGQRAVIAGRVPKIEQPDYIGGYAVLFPLEAGMVLPQPYENFDWEGMSFGALKDAMGPRADFCGGH